MKRLPITGCVRQQAVAASSLDQEFLFHQGASLYPSLQISLATEFLMHCGDDIASSSGLSFLGIGVPADLVTWGSLLNEARSNSFAWWLAVFPGVAIFLAVVAYYLVGEGLRDALDPRLQ